MIDKETGAFKGTAFVKFSRPEQAQRCVDAFQTCRGAVLIKDRECRADIAVDRTEIATIKSQRNKFGANKPTDKRNLYLANEGLVVPGKADKVKGKARYAHTLQYTLLLYYYICYTYAAALHYYIPLIYILLSPLYSSSAAPASCPISS